MRWGSTDLEELREVEDDNEAAFGRVRRRNADEENCGDQIWDDQGDHDEADLACLLCEEGTSQAETSDQP